MNLPLKLKFAIWAGRRGILGVLLVGLTVAALFLLLSATTPAAAARWQDAAPGEPLALADRVACQTAIEQVNWQARIWPAGNPEAKPALADVLPEAVVAARVQDSLAQSQALAERYGLELTPAMLQAEIGRQAAQTQEPARLAALWAALGDNPVLVAECVARPALAQRLLHQEVAADAALAETSLAAWWPAVADQFTFDLRQPAAAYTLPEIDGAPADFGGDSWSDTSSIPIQTEGGGVWTGAEMVYLGEFATEGYLYNPATDSWRTTTHHNSPFERKEFSTVWTGTEMIIWGGCNGGSEFCTTASGGRYNPTTDTWIRPTTAGAPNPRRYHGAVWTGSEMIVWGGCREDANGNQNCDIVMNSGGRYDPVTDSWELMTLTNAPQARNVPELVWAGDQMVLWSGTAASDPGGRYDPVTDTWSDVSTTGAPAGRLGSLVWTGSDVLAWGGCTGSPQCNVPQNGGGQYDPVNDTWSSLTSSGAPAGRWFHDAVWTDSEMIVWGGATDTASLGDGGRYDPVSDSWTGMSSVNAPSGRVFHQLLWTGSELLVWGGTGVGDTRNGARYAPDTDQWVPISDEGPDSIRTTHTAVWTGAEMIVWGGLGDGTAATGLDTGRLYDPATDSWAETTLDNAPSRRSRHTMIWTGTEAIVWGGNVATWSQPGTGGRYNPMTDTWVATTIDGAPEAPSDHSAVWTGSEMIVWGGSIFNNLWHDGGARYNPASDSWTTMTQTGAPEERYHHSALWTGAEVLVWGGSNGTGMLGTGARYQPTSDSWEPISNANAPEGRTLHAAVWTGAEMLIWGGATDFWTYATDGGRYNPIDDSWAPMSTTDMPEPVAGPSAVWTGSEMIVWGGCHDSQCLFSVETGGRYDPLSDSWTATTQTDVPQPREAHTAVWTGSSMIVWGGTTDRAGYTNTGAVYHVTSGGNQSPWAVNDAYEASVEATLVITAPGVLVNDGDPDGDVLTATLVTQAEHGTVNLSGDGGFTYAADNDYRGPDAFVYQVADGNGGFALATVYLTVTGPEYRASLPIVVKK